MSTRQLTALQEAIIDALANDYEDLQRIYEMVEGDPDDAPVRVALWDLIEMGHVACYTPAHDSGMVLDRDPNRDRLPAYWFALTDAGEVALSALEAAE